MKLPLVFWIGLVAAVIASLLLVRWVARSERRRAVRMIAAFVRMFPDRCPLCAYHRHAISNGADFPLGPHMCLEGRSPPSPPAKATAKWTTLL